MSFKLWPWSRRAAHEAADRGTADTVNWNVPLGTSDFDLLNERELLLDRQRDSVRNNPLSAGYVQHRLDSVIGYGLKLVPRPNYRALGQTAEWADEWQREVKSMWTQFTEDLDFYIDWTRRANFAQLLRKLYMSYIFNSEMIAVIEWREERGKAFAHTAINVVHPDLLCNPFDQPDSWTLRRGIELDPVTQEPIAYYFRQVKKRDDGVTGAPSYVWRRVPTYTAWGRRQVVHIFDAADVGDVRGRPTFASALLELRSLKRFRKEALAAQIVQAMYAAVIESSATATDVARALGGGPAVSEGPLKAYMAAQGAFHKKHTVTVNGTKVPHLVPGENLKFMTPGNTAPTLDAFEQSSIRHLSRALPGVSAEALSGDYSRTSYSSAGAADLNPWRFLMGERALVATPLASAVYACFLEEMLDTERISKPANAPSYWDAKTAWTQCKWIGAPRGQIDDLKAQEARQLERQMGVLTHEDHCAENGCDSDEVIDRLALERKKFVAAEIPELLPQAIVKAKQAANANAGANDARPGDNNAA